MDEVATLEAEQKEVHYLSKFFEGDDYFAPGEYDYIFDAVIFDDGVKRPIPYR